MVVVIRDSVNSTTSVVERAVVQVLSSGAQGPSGPAGPPGPQATAYFTMTAGTVLSGHRVVKPDGAGAVVYADSENAADAFAVIGVTLTAALLGDSVNVQASGEVDEPSWNWVPGQPVFAGPSGMLTQVAPVTGFCLVIGVAMTPTKLSLSIKQPIIL